MTPPCPAPPGCRWVALALGCPGDAWGLEDDNAAPRLLAVHYADGWTLCDGAGTILRDAVADARLPEVVAAALNRPPTE